MKVKLIKIVREIDNNNYATTLCEYHRTETLLMDPQMNTVLVLDKGRFCINGIIQNLRDEEILLLEDIDIPYQKNYKGEFFEKLNSVLEDEGWKKANFHVTHAS